MKARIGTVEVEGTPEEIGALLRSFNDSPPTGGIPTPSSAGDTFVSEEIAFRALKRRQLSPEQKIMLSLLKANNPAWTTAKELQKAMGYSPSQFAGLMGAFGKRIGSTDGYVDYTSFFEQEWDYEQDCNRYRLPAGPLAAVRRAGI